MISSTGKKKKSNSAARFPLPGPRKNAVGCKQYGFTLLELLLVTIIILALVGISTPLFKRTYENLRLTTSTKEMAFILKFCREKSIFERRDYRFTVDSKEKSYRIFVKDEDDFKPLGSKWGRNFKLPDDIDIESEKENIDFSPNGSITSASIYLANKEGGIYTIITEDRTGSINLYDYKKE